MSIIKCIECGNELSANMTKCPVCGSPVKKKLTKWQWVFVVLATFVIVGIWNKPEKPLTPEQAKAQEAKQAQDEVDKKVFRRELATLVVLRKMVNDPDSLEIDSQFTSPTTGAVCIKYRAKNGFGAVVRGYAATQGNKLVATPAAYKKECM